MSAVFGNRWLPWLVLLGLLIALIYQLRLFDHEHTLRVQAEAAVVESKQETKDERQRTFAALARDKVDRAAYDHLASSLSETCKGSFSVMTWPDGRVERTCKGTETSLEHHGPEFAPPPLPIASPDRGGVALPSSPLKGTMCWTLGPALLYPWLAGIHGGGDVGNLFGLDLTAELLLGVPGPLVLGPLPGRAADHIMVGVLGGVRWGRGEAPARPLARP